MRAKVIAAARSPGHITRDIAELAIGTRFGDVIAVEATVGIHAGTGRALFRLGEGIEVPGPAVDFVAQPGIEYLARVER
ncbi:hypothetical protein D3C86_1731550 [compost metagenome]